MCWWENATQGSRGSLPVYLRPAREACCPKSQVYVLLTWQLAALTLPCLSSASSEESMKWEVSLHCSFLEELPSQHYPNVWVDCTVRKCMLRVIQTWLSQIMELFLLQGNPIFLSFYCLKYFNLSFLLKRKKNIKKLKICRNLSRKFASYLLPLSTFLF